MLRKTRTILSLIGLVMTLLAVAAGCGGPKKLPSQWLDRRLFESNHSYVYASDTRSAKATQGLVRKIAKQFEEATGRQAPRMLIIVTDVDDDPLVADLYDMYRLTFRYNMPSLERRAEQDLQRRWEGMWQFRNVLHTHSFLLAKQDLTSSLGLDSQLAESIPWAAAIQTKTLMRQALQELTDQAEERMFNAVQGEGTKQAGLKLFVGLKSFELLSKMKAKRDSIIFAALVASHHDLNENERNELVSTYWRWAKSGPSWLRGRPPFDRKSLNKDH